ncbi:hypothetical protein CHELA41_23778 [Hyphomicrobiales bacterium]|nr:hypothetical protein CHELA41_23778 [Hyphomicrobiales bacterium]
MCKSRACNYCAVMLAGQDQRLCAISLDAVIVQVRPAEYEVCLDLAMFAPACLCGDAGSKRLALSKRAKFKYK